MPSNFIRLSWVPDSAILPSFITMILSAPTIVFSLCAMTSKVLPLIRISPAEYSFRCQHLCCSCLVKDNNGRSFQDTSCNRKSLRLTTRKRCASLSYYCVKAIGQLQLPHLLSHRVCPALCYYRPCHGTDISAGKPYQQLVL